MTDTASRTAAAFDLTLEGIVQRYRGAAAAAVDGISLQTRPGELVALLGPSGCGKTTLLRIIAGFVEQTEGRVLVGGRPIDGLPPNERAVGVVFQNYALFPHMTALENVGYGLACRGEPRARQAARAREMLEMVKMGHLAQRLPREMSGGQQQRVALARALAVDPRILLLDEPFAALDKSLRLDMQIEVKRIQRMAGITCIMVTHDQEEALSMADRVAVIDHGRLEQFDAPNEVYDRPASLFVNRFVGAANSLPGRIVSVDGSGRGIVEVAGLACDARIAGGAPGDAVTVCMRPEQLVLQTDGPGMPGRLSLSLPQGPHIIQEVQLADARSVKVVQSRAEGLPVHAPGTELRTRLRPGVVVNAFPA
jgi:putative spermidine/putrescine transport system ATP-binding protein